MMIVMYRYIDVRSSVARVDLFDRSFIIQSPSILKTVTYRIHIIYVLVNGIIFIILIIYYCLSLITFYRVVETQYYPNDRRRRCHSFAV